MSKKKIIKKKPLNLSKAPKKKPLRGAKPGTKNFPKKPAPSRSAQRIESSHKSPKQEKLFGNLLKVTYSFIKGRDYQPLTMKALIERLHIAPANIPLFKEGLSFLVHEGKVRYIKGVYHQTETDSFHLRDGEKVVRGELSVHPRGFGFIDQPEQDIFIPKPLMNGALDGDIVDAAIDTFAFSEKGPEGRVLRIVERKRTALVGIVTLVSGAHIHLFSSLLGEHHDVRLEGVKKDAVKPGDRISIHVTTWGEKDSPTIGTLSEHLGHIRDAASDLPYILKASNLRVEFPPEAIVEAQRFGDKVKQAEIKGRADLRNLECFTIDPDTAKDFDDALSLEHTHSGYRLGVHIADVSHYVKEGSALDSEARKRANSTYFPNHCIPMLPRELSENLCSLKPHVNRLAVSVFFDIDENGNTRSWEIVRSVIKSHKRFTYKEVKEILDEKTKSPFHSKLKLMMKLCHLLQKQRHERGSVQLALPELIVRINERGEPTGTELIEYDISHQIVEEFMLKANEIVAIELSRRGKDLTYRVHEEPSAESLQDFATLVAAFGYKIPSNPEPKDIQKLFLEIENTRHAPFLSVCYIRSMRLACYSPDNIGHYGLGLEHYCHFTSPIRRYVDTIIHRLLFEKGPPREEIETICEEASERERASARAEGALIMTKKLRLLNAWHKKSPRRVYQAIITRVKPFGIFFDITDLMLEGFLHVSELEDDYFLFDEDTSQLVGRYEGITYGCGEKISVSLRHVDLLLQETSWTFVNR